jgi:cation diffusion facilitator CzcD-associated flavoprotein CzcO
MVKQTPSVTIVGGGFGGIAAAVKLKRAGITTFTIYEKSEGIGGTWRDNVYPGAEVDVGSHLYSFSFRRNDWSRTHARQAELQRYLEDVVDEFGLRPHLRLGTEVRSATWDEKTHTYTIHLANGETFASQVLISAVGLLNVPRYPDWPGLEEFQGPKFHTARWEHQHELSGKRIAIVGTGSTSSQLVPALAPIAGHVTLFQREPGWVIPKGDRDFTSEERSTLSRRLAYRRQRLRLLWQIERGQIRGSIHRPGTKVNARREEQCRGYIDHVFKDRPDLRRMVTPDYPYPGKRPILTGTFYPALLRDNVELVPHAVTSVTPHGIVDAQGVEHPADVLVMATGFQPTHYLATLDIVGCRGVSLQEFWHGEPRAFLGMTVPGFPNFYMLYGPNTNGGEIISHLERQAEYVVRSLRRMTAGGITAIEVRQRAYELFNWWLQRGMTRTAWVVANNYYKAPSGRVVTQWPYGSLLYGALTKLLGRVSESTRTLR